MVIPTIETVVSGSEKNVIEINGDVNGKVNFRRGGTKPMENIRICKSYLPSAASIFFNECIMAFK